MVNDEENRREDADALAAAGVTLHSMSPRSVADVGPAVRDLAHAVDAPVPMPFAAGAWEAWLEAGAPAPRGRVAVLVWRRPWMTMRADTYGADLLDRLGWSSTGGEGPDRYPEVTLPQLAALGPELVVLPSEPYPFAARHVAEITAAFPGARVALVDGRDLFWWGIRTPDAVERLVGPLGQ